MTVEINEGTATCAVQVGERRVVCALDQVRVTTDPETRMSVLALPDARVHITSDDAQRLVALGVKDDRFHLYTHD